MFKKKPSHLTANIEKKCLRIIHHHHFLSQNLHAKSVLNSDLGIESIYDENKRRTSEFNYVVPLPFLRMKKIPRGFMHGTDPCLELVRKKAKWKNSIKRAVIESSKQMSSKDIQKIKSRIKKGNKSEELPRRIVELGRILKEDPDDQFDGYYNWFYHGGCLNKITIDGVQILLRSRGKMFDRLGALPVYLHENKYLKPDFTQESYFGIGNKDPVLQIVANQEKGLLGARQRKSCYIFSLSYKSKSLKFSQVKQVESSSPFTSIDFDESTGNFVTMQTTQRACLHNLGKESSVKEWNVPRSSADASDNWCSAIFSQNKNNNIICANRDTIRIYDTKARKMECMELSPREMPNSIEHCEEITCFKEGTRKAPLPLVYVATTHQMLAVDLRFPKTFIQRWTHAMKHAPCYMCTCQFDNGGNLQELVFLSSQIYNEIHAIVNNLSTNETTITPCSTEFPYSLPSYTDTLNLANWHGKLLDPLIEERFSAVTVGMCPIEGPQGGIAFMTNNSLGDVFQHIITKKDSCSVKLQDVLHIISTWEKSEPKVKKPRKKLITVVRKDQQNLLTRIQSRLNSAEIGEANEGHSLENAERKTLDDWKISKKRLLLYNDLLASKLLTTWNIDSIPEWEEDDDVIELPSSQNTVDKVNQWLGGLTMTSSTPTSSQIQPCSQYSEPQFSEIIDATAIGITPIKRKSSANISLSKKKRFTDGF